MFVSWNLDVVYNPFLADSYHPCSPHVNDLIGRRTEKVTWQEFN